MHSVSDRSGNITVENSIQDRLLEAVYNHTMGRILLRPFLAPIFSKMGGALLSTGFSKVMIGPFVRSHSINMSEYEQQNYNSYNDFFTRKIKSGARKAELAENVLISPCDGRLCVYPVRENSVVTIKHTPYTVGSLVRNQKIARRYAGGYLWVFRLCVEDYHRYVYADSGKVSAEVQIPGVFHTVNPVANDNFPIYKENTREYALLKSEQLGTILQMEVGAMLVGRIRNRPGNRYVQRGEEKGNFAFGGSTVILITQKGQVCPDSDILSNSMRGIETRVRLGEQVGKKQI